MKKIISREDYDQAEAKYLIANTILNEEEGKPLLSYIDSYITESENQVLSGTIRNLEQEGLVNGIRSLIKITKKERMDELRGGYQAISTLRATLLDWENNFKELNKAIKNEEIKIAENK